MVAARRSLAMAELGRTRKQRETFQERRRPHQHELSEVVAVWNSVATSCNHGSLAMGVPNRFGGMEESRRD